MTDLGEGHAHAGLVVEDRAHVVIATTLARRILVDEIAWLDAETLDHVLRWSGPRGDGDFKPRDVSPVGPGGRRLRLSSRIAGEPLRPEANMHRRVLLAFETLDPRPEIVIVARDGDGRAVERRRGFEQVVHGLPWSFPVILAMPEPESEAWFICGFEPRDDGERERLRQLIRDKRLNFNSVEEPHRLTSRPNDATTDAKRIAAALLGDAEDRRLMCLSAPLDRLAQRGGLAGLADFIADLRRLLVPIVDPGARSNL